jgi:endonuclease-8
MPEGDTIFRAARTLQRALAGKAVTRFQSVFPKLNRVDEDAPLKGRTVEEISASGKHLLMRFSGDLVLRTHMRMNGSWHIYRHGERWLRPRSAMRIVLETADFVVVGFDVPVAEFLDSRQVERHEELRKLGPDLLQEEFDPLEAARRLRERTDLEAGEALLNQRVMAGIGNVFKSEILFACGVSPFTPVRELTEDQISRLVSTSRKFLQANVIDGKGDGIVTYTGFRRTTGRADPAARLWVYGRHGEPCRKCGTPIAFRKQGPHARVTYWCPRCQPEAQAASPEVPP